MNVSQFIIMMNMPLATLECNSLALAGPLSRLVALHSGGWQASKSLASL
jgi:hypothetical protein